MRALTLTARWGGLLVALTAIHTTIPPTTAGADVVTDRERGLARLDFRQVVKEAKAHVFPTVVFIKALRQGMERGQKMAHSRTN